MQQAFLKFHFQFFDSSLFEGSLWLLAQKLCLISETANGQLMGFPLTGSLSPSHLAGAGFTGLARLGVLKALKRFKIFLTFNSVNSFQHDECFNLLNII